VLDEASTPAHSHSEEAGEEMAHRRRVHRLAALSKAGADYVVALPDESGAPAEAWGTELTPELNEWMRQTVDTCQQLATILQIGTLNLAEARGPEAHMVLLPSDQTTFLVSWPPATKADDLTEQAKQLIATWDS
jgi:hypothetical protein